jgi:hypothetical protein
MLRLLLSLEFVPVRMDHHRRADGADLVVLHRRLRDTQEAAVSPVDFVRHDPQAS